LRSFCKEKVLHANDRILQEYMLDPASQKPDDQDIDARFHNFGKIIWMF